MGDGITVIVCGGADAACSFEPEDDHHGYCAKCGGHAGYHTLDPDDGRDRRAYAEKTGDPWPTFSDGREIPPRQDGHPCGRCRTLDRSCGHHDHELDP